MLCARALWDSALRREQPVLKPVVSLSNHLPKDSERRAGASQAILSQEAAARSAAEGRQVGGAMRDPLPVRPAGLVKRVEKPKFSAF